MRFLRNTWSAAGWVTQLKKAPIAITILDEPLLIVCAEDGTPSALTD
ncbi:aromatic ring-hydroxylating dioxygenase subunit alpha, partial [Pseudomaricurvus alcaniphilus]|nr:aromatic ring-hydroxylating dioxygenase subunit alpha [Pseudomaricurvus alcaniphilus]